MGRLFGIILNKGYENMGDTVIGADVLLTWNCKHMANPHALPKTRHIVTASGYVCPQVMTPKTFLDNLNMEAENA